MCQSQEPSPQAQVLPWWAGSLTLRQSANFVGTEDQVISGTNGQATFTQGSGGYCAVAIEIKAPGGASNKAFQVGGFLVGP